jgi:hypothetical protein
LVDIGRSLCHAREAAGLSLLEAAVPAGLPSDELEALESGATARLHDRIATLRALRAYADSLGLPGDDYVLAAVDLWPVTLVPPPRRGDSGPVPVVSVSSAPAGGHSPTEARGVEWAGDPTGAALSTVSGQVSSVIPLSLHDTGPVPAADTGETPAVRQGAPRLLKVLVVVAALLVVCGGVALVERTHVVSWYHQVSATSSRWYREVRADVGLKPKAVAPASANGLPKVTIVENGATNAVTINVNAASFSVKMAAFNAPSWMQVTDDHDLEPIYSQVMPGGQTQTFLVNGSTTIETASTSARAYLYEGTTFIGYYFPSQVPFTMTHIATG